MIQTHLMKLEAPYRVLNIDGQLVRHVATLIEVRETYNHIKDEETIMTISHPVIDYGNNAYSGIVLYDKEIEECDVLPKVLSQPDFHLMVHNAQQMFNPKVISQKPEHIVQRLADFGISIEWPKQKDEDGYDTNEDATVVEVPISLGYSKEQGYWWAESSVMAFCFDAKGKKSDKELLNYIREMRSSYYKAFPDRQFDIVFRNKQNEVQYLIDELNANPHL